MNTALNTLRLIIMLGGVTWAALTPSVWMLVIIAFTTLAVIGLYEATHK